MKKRNLPSLVLIALCVGVYLGYCFWDRITTDTTAPQIFIEDQLPAISVNSTWEEMLNGVTAIDDADGDVTNSLVVENVRLADRDEGLIVVSVAAFDKSSNVAKSQYEIHYTDYHSPRFSLTRPLVFSSNSVPDPLSFVSADDLIDGKINRNIRVTSLSSKAVTSVGTHDVEFRVTNSLGDMAKLIIPVEIYPAGTYAAEVSLSDYLIYLKVGDNFRAKDYLRKFIMNKNATSLTGILPEGFDIEISGEVDTNTPGVYAVSYTVSYTMPGFSAGNEQIYTGYSKLIVVVEG